MYSAELKVAVPLNVKSCGQSFLSSLARFVLDLLTLVSFLVVVVSLFCAEQLFPPLMYFYFSVRNSSDILRYELCAEKVFFCTLYFQAGVHMSASEIWANNQFHLTTNELVELELRCWTSQVLTDIYSHRLQAVLSRRRGLTNTLDRFAIVGCCLSLTSKTEKKF